MNTTRRNLRILIRRSLKDLLTTATVAAITIGTSIAIIHSGLPGDQIMRWTGFSLITGVIFWYAIADRSASLKNRPLWLVAALVLLAHCVTWSVVLTHVEAWRLIWFGPLISLEIIAIFYCIDRLCRKPRSAEARTPSRF